MKPAKTHYHALIQFPHSSFADVTQIEGMQFNGMSRTDEGYTADISFYDFGTLESVYQFGGTVSNLVNGEHVRDGDLSAPAPATKINVAKYKPRGKTRRVIARRRAGVTTKADELRNYLASSTFRTMAEIEKAVKQKQSSIQARFTAFRAKGILEQKERDGRQVYRVKKA